MRRVWHRYTFVQQAREAVYLPGGWAHATFNLDDGFAFGQQKPLGEREVEFFEGHLRTLLDTKPEDRFAHIVPHVNKTVWGFWDKYFANDKLLTDALFLLRKEGIPISVDATGHLPATGA